MTELDVVKIAKELRRIVNRLNYAELPIEERNELLERYFFIMEDAEKNNININEGMRLYENYRKRNQRLRKRISNIIDCDSLFLTFTFTDDVLNSTSRDTRQIYVRRFLKSISTNYVANVDFGAENGREHYHAVISGIDFDMSDWDQYGFSDCRTIGRKDDECTSSKISKYIYKLSNHATKETTRRKKIIYSREERINCSINNK